MDGIQLRDEAVRDRIRAAEEFLDPRKKKQVAEAAIATTTNERHRGPSRTQLPGRDLAHAQSRST